MGMAPWSGWRKAPKQWSKGWGLKHSHHQSNPEGKLSGWRKVSQNRVLLKTKLLYSILLFIKRKQSHHLCYPWRKFHISDLNDNGNRLALRDRSSDISTNLINSRQSWLDAIETEMNMILFASSWWHIQAIFIARAMNHWSWLRLKHSNIQRVTWSRDHPDERCDRKTSPGDLDQIIEGSLIGPIAELAVASGIRARRRKWSIRSIKTAFCMSKATFHIEGTSLFFVCLSPPVEVSVVVCFKFSWIVIHLPELLEME
jgi:hypothetical protein